MYSKTSNLTLKHGSMALIMDCFKAGKIMFLMNLIIYFMLMQPLQTQLLVKLLEYIFQNEFMFYTNLEDSIWLKISIWKGTKIYISVWIFC